MLRGVVSKGRKDNPEEHVPMASFVMTAYHFPVSHVIEPFSDDWNKVGVCWLCHSTQLQYYAVLLRYYSLLQSFTPYYKVQLCTAKYWSSTTNYYELVEISTKYYSALESTIPLPQSNTQYYCAVNPRPI